MAEPCAVCSKVLMEEYRVRDRFGKPTQLGRVIANLLDEASASPPFAISGIHWSIASSKENLSFGQRGKKGALPNGGPIPD